MYRLSTSHLVKPQIKLLQSHRIITQHKPIQSIRQTHSNVTLSKYLFAISSILSTQQSRTNFETIKSNTLVNSRLYFKRRRETKPKSDQSPPPEVEDAPVEEEEEPLEYKKPEFTAKFKSLPEYNTFIEQALSHLDTNPYEAITNAAMAYETLNGMKDKPTLAQGYLTCKEIMVSAYMRLKDYENAQKSIDDMLKISPRSFRAYVKRGRIYYELGDYKQAEEWFAKAIKEVPTEGKTYIRRGYALIKSGKIEEAHDTIEQGLRLIGDHESLLYWKALGLAGIQHHQEAAEVLDLALQKPGALLDCHRLKAMVLQDAGKFEEATLAAEVGVQRIQKMQQPNENLLNTLWRIQGACYVSAEKFRDAIESLQHLPPSAQTNMTLGHCYYEYMEYQIAADFFDQAISLAETPAEQALARFRKSLALFKLGKKSQAKQLFEESIELGLQTYYLELFTAKGHRAMELQKAADVFSLIDQMAGPTSDDLRIQVIRGIALLKTGKTREAISVLKRASTMGCDPSILRSLEIAALMESGKYAVQRLADAYSLQSTDVNQAIEIYHKVLNSLAGMESPVIYQTCMTELAKCYLKAQQYDKAEKYAQYAAETNDAGALLMKAEALFYQGKFKASLQTYEEGLKHVSHFMAIARKQDEEVTKAILEEAISQKPKFEPLFSSAEMALSREKHNQRILTFNPDYVNAMLNKATAQFTLKDFHNSIQTCQQLELQLLEISSKHEHALQEAIGIRELEGLTNVSEHIKQTVKSAAASTPEVEQAAAILEAVKIYIVKLTRIQALNFLSLGNKSIAESAYDRCIAMLPSLDSYQQKIRFLMDQKRYEDVINTCEQGINAGLSKEDCRELLEIEARTHLLMDDLEGAVEVFKKLQKIAKQKWRALFNIGVLYRKMGSHEKALKTLNEALTYKTSTNIPPEYLRGIALEKARCFMSLEAFDRAAKNLQDFVSISLQERLPLKHGFTVLWNLAYCYYQINNYAMMHDVATRLVERYSANPVSHFLLGLAFQGLDKPTEALRCFDKSLELNPNQPDVENAKQRFVQKLAGLSSLDGLRMSAPPQVSMEQST